MCVVDPSLLRVSEGQLPLEGGALFRVFFSDASGVLYPCVLPVAGAAVHSILVATTAQPARMQGFWDGCREAGARVSTLLCGIVCADS